MKVAILVLMLVLATTQVSAGYIEDYYGIKTVNTKMIQAKEVTEELPTCGEEVYNEYLNVLEQKPYYEELMNIFGDGEYLIHFTDENYEEYFPNNYFSITKQNNAITSVKQGICSTTNTAYTVNIDLTETKKTFEEPGVNQVLEGYKVLKNIEGPTIIQRIRVILLAYKQNWNQQ